MAANPAADGHLVLCLGCAPSYFDILALLLVVLSRRGQVLLATVNEAAMVPFVSQQLNNLDLALALAKRGNLPGAEGLIVQQFEKLFGAGQYKEAAECAAESPQVCLRLGWC